MSLSLFNTLTREVERFDPLIPDRVSMYVCGPTVYDFAHLGNARPVVVFDILYRHLKRRYRTVTYVRNITDVDDKIMDRARETGETIEALTTRTTAAYHADMEALGTLRPDIEPRATQHIAEMIGIIEILMAQGHAYAAEGHVLFHVPSMRDYGQLSRRSRDDLVAGARVEVAPYKKDPADFVLWKPSAADQPGWDSPWGRGRPGWHIECSAMAKKHLGVTFDIHGGGLDLIFPHHENEIAQSRCAHDGAPLARYWLHNGFLTISGDKMSKSLGNFFTVRQLLAGAPGEAVRLTLLSAHYRQPLDFSIEGLRQAKATLDRFYGALRSAAALPTEPATVPAGIEAALDDDLNTPLALAVLHDLAGALHRAETPAEKAKAKGPLIAGGQALGLLTSDPEAWFRWQPAGAATMDEAEIEQQIAARAAARQAKNYAEGDRIRDALLAAGIALEDTAKGTLWKRV